MIVTFFNFIMSVKEAIVTTCARPPKK